MQRNKGVPRRAEMYTLEPEAGNAAVGIVDRCHNACPRMDGMRFFLPRLPSFTNTTDMKVKVNDKELECQSTHLSELVTELGMPEKGIAVAVQKKMIPRAQWSAYELHEGMDIIIIKAVCGG